MDTASSYDSVAAEYARRFSDEIRHKPFDRKMLDWLIEKVDGLGTICDVGCGPGQVARYLSDRGVPALGIDVSPALVEQARKLSPGIPYSVGNILHLDSVADNSFGGVTAFYCLIHFSDNQLTTALRELHRILLPGGTLLITFHLGSETRHLDEWWGQIVDLDFHFFERDEMKAWLTEAGFELEEVLERDPYREVEVATRRAYIFARKP